VDIGKNPKFKILISLFSKKKKRSFNVFVFESLRKKTLYDKEYFGFRDRNYGKKNAHNIEPRGFGSYNDPIIKSYSNLRNKPITLTYYLEEEK